MSGPLTPQAEPFAASHNFGEETGKELRPVHSGDLSVGQLDPSFARAAMAD
eukprot:gene36150-3973_t